MLTGLDESLHHQTSLTFDHVHTSDHRFYDRQLITGFGPDGEAGFLAGITVFKNMNVIEGYVIAQSHSSRQINVRFTRPLRPIEVGMNVGIGPLRLEILEPLERTRLVLESGEFPLALDLTFEGTIPAHLENPHVGRMDGRTHSDYLRYHQVGRVSGWITIEGERFDAAEWFSWRDHSWGVRPVVGGFEPFTGTKTVGGVASASRTGGKGLFLIYVGFSNRHQAGGVQIIEDGEGKRIYLDGEVREIGGEAIPVAAARHEIVFLPGTRVFETANLTLSLANGETWQLNARAVGRPWAFCGGGTDGGFFDGHGQGVWRGADLITEVDIYDVTHPERVIGPDGRLILPKHREQLTACEINNLVGSAYVPMFVIGDQPRFGLPPRPPVET